MDSWFASLKRGLSRTLPHDRLSEKPGYGKRHANLKNLQPFLARHWRKGVMGAVLILFGSLLAFPQPLITRYLIDDVILAKRLGSLLGVVALLAGIKILGMAAGLIQQFTFTRFEQDIIIDIQQALLDRTLRLPKSFFDDQETGYLMSRLSSDVQGLRWFFSSTLVYLASSVLRLCGGVVLLFYLEWRLALAALIVVPGLVLSVRYFSGKLYILGHHSMEQQADISRQMQESLSSSDLIKSFASEDRTVARLTSAWRAAQRLTLEQTSVGSLANLAIGAMPDIAGMMVLLAGAYWVIRGEWTLGSLLAFQSYLGYVFGPAMSLANMNLQLQNATASLERVSVLFDIVPEENLGTGMRVERLEGRVEFRHVSFSYAESEPVLHDISFLVSPGEHVAIVGPSGVGKTTLISLIMRFYKPSAGEIWFDGRAAADYELSSLRRRIGYVSQSPRLLTGTIMDNLRYGNPEADEEQVIRAAQTAGIHEYIASLPEGYNSTVGERGVNLSEGQKQRLAIARALLKNPDIMILDEPTSALDSLVEKSIFEALPAMMRQKSLFVVAHRLSTIQNADRILLLNEKRLVAMGTHGELVEKSPYYRSLVANQQIVAPPAGQISAAP